MTNSVNTLDSFYKDGFKIIRNGEIIELTSEEMQEFNYLEMASLGRECLDVFQSLANEDEIPIIEKMKIDKNMCYLIEEDILEIALSDVGHIERDVIEKYIEERKNGD